MSPLGYRNFALYWVGIAISNIGRWVELTGGVWLVVELTDSPVLLGLLGVCRGVPAILFGPIAGVIADRVDQRKLLFTTQGLSLVTSLGLGLLVAGGAVEFWHVYVQVTLQSTIEAFDAAVRQAMFPRLVSRQHRAEAVTLTMTAGRAAKFVGPAIGGILIASLGVSAPFFVNAATFPMLMIAIVWIHGLVPRARIAGSSIKSELAEGAHFLVREPVLSGLLKMEVVFAIFGMNAVMITIVGRDVLGVGPEGVGGLLSAPGVGSLIGIGFLLVRGQTRRQGRFVVLCTFAYVVTLVLFAASVDYTVSFVALAASGLFDVLVGVTRQSIMQLTAPGRMRGRIMGNVRMVTGGVTQLSQTQSGMLAGAIGAPLAVLAAAATLGIAAAATARANPALWGFLRDRAHRTQGLPIEPASIA